jgi:hypothetical protein
MGFREASVLDGQGDSVSTLQKAPFMTGFSH